MLGRLVRVVLLGIVADHPAMVKLAGFADKTHNEAPCSKCTVSLEDMFSDEALRCGEPCLVCIYNQRLNK